jgi:hypothetical protein
MSKDNKSVVGTDNSLENVEARRTAAKSFLDNFLIPARHTLGEVGIKGISFFDVIDPLYNMFIKSAVVPPAFGRSDILSAIEKDVNQNRFDRSVIQVNVEHWIDMHARAEKGYIDRRSSVPGQDDLVALKNKIMRIEGEVVRNKGKGRYELNKSQERLLKGIGDKKNLDTFLDLITKK